MNIHPEIEAKLNRLLEHYFWEYDALHKEVRTIDDVKLAPLDERMAFKSTVTQLVIELLGSNVCPLL